MVSSEIVIVRLVTEINDVINSEIRAKCRDIPALCDFLVKTSLENADVEVGAYLRIKQRSLLKRAFSGAALFTGQGRGEGRGGGYAYMHICI